MFLDSEIGSSQIFDRGKADYVAPASQFSFDTEARIMPPSIMGLNVLPLQLTDHSLRQVLAKLGPAHFGKGSNKVLPYEYFSAAEVGFRAEMLNHIKQAALGDWMAREYNGHCRAVVAGKYPGGLTEKGYENTSYLTALQFFMNESGKAGNSDLHLVRPVVTPDAIYMRAVWKELPDPTDPNQRWGLGIFLRNSETGDGAAEVMGLIKRGSCDNTIMPAEKGMRIEHRGSYAFLKTSIKEAIGKILGIGAHILERMWQAAEEEVPDIEDVLAGLAREHQWPTKIQVAISHGFDGGTSRQSLINGVSWAAHTAIEDAAQQADMEILAGALLDVSQDKLASYAREAFRGRKAR